MPSDLLSIISLIVLTLIPVILPSTSGMIFFNSPESIVKSGYWPVPSSIIWSPLYSIRGSIIYTEDELSMWSRSIPVK